MTLSSPYAGKLQRVRVQTHRLEVLGSGTAYWEYGPEEATRTIVMVHGFRGDHHGLEPVIADLDGARILAPDLPGFGESAPLSIPHDIAGYSTWLRAFVAALDLTQPPVVLGHSFGSIVVAAAIADGLPASSVILINPIAANALAGPRALATKLAVAYYRAGAALPERAGFALLRNRAIVRGMSVAMAKTRDRQLRRWIHDQHRRYFSLFADRRVVLEAFRASVTDDVSGFADRIHLPVLLIGSDRDDITTVEAQRALARRLDDATLHVIAGVGHLIHYEAPGQAAAHIQSFLRSRSAS